MRKLILLVAFIFLTIWVLVIVSAVMTAPASTQDWSNNQNLKRAAVVATAMVVCHMDSPENDRLVQAYFDAAEAETGMPSEVAVVIAKANAVKIINYIANNNKVDEFCSNALAANW